MGAARKLAELAAAYNTGNALSFRNKIINGDFRIDQRKIGLSHAITTAGGYTVDRMYAIATGASATGQRVPGLGSSQFNYLINGAAGVTGISIGQRIEATDAYDLIGSTTTLSVDLANSTLPTVTWTAYYAGATDNWAAPVQFATGTFTVNSTLTRYSAPIGVPVAAATGIMITLSVGAQTSGTWRLGRLQLEPGSVATAFERRSAGSQLFDCKRFFEKSYDQPTAPGSATSSGAAFVIANGVTSANQAASIQFSAEKRSVPVLNLWDLAGNVGKASAFDSAASRTDNHTQAAPTYSVGTHNAVLRCSNGVTGAVVIAYQWTADSEL